MLILTAALLPVIIGPPALPPVDGDTFRFEGLAVKIRLWGIDSPERGEAGYANAKATLGTLLDRGDVQCTALSVDRYERIVARCSIGGKDIGKMMIDRGAAIEYCKYSKGEYGTCDR